MSATPASVAAIHRQVKALGAPARAAASRWYFKTGPGQYGEGDRFLGLTVPMLRAMAREHRLLPLRTTAALLKSPWHEERLLALLILVRQYGGGTPVERDAIHRLYLGSTKHINNWDLVDLSAHHIVGAHLPPGRRTLLVRLARSPDVWERRIAVLATFAYIKDGEFRDALRVATLLVHDEHDVIHKATGWMLREIGKRDRGTEEAFLGKHAAHMPRTMLRYAVERFPERIRRKYMKASR